jgi:hypothetical protein
MEITDFQKTSYTIYFGLIAKLKNKIEIEATLTIMYDLNSGTEEYHLTTISDYTLTDKEYKKLKKLAIKKYLNIKAIHTNKTIIL